jgi:predicted tellurium resistance membrane protein TerC
MGLDNVLAVAGAAQGSFVLVVLGLLVSIPIVIWGSQLVLKFVDRFPSIVYVGAGVLAWTAVKMIVSDPLLEELFAESAVLAALAYVLVIGAIVVGGFLVNHAGGAVSRLQRFGIPAAVIAVIALLIATLG